MWFKSNSKLKTICFISKFNVRKKYGLGIVFLFGIFISLSFTYFGEDETYTSEQNLVPDLYSGVNCMTIPAKRLQINMQDIYTSSKPLAPKLESKWQTNLKISSTSEKAKEFFNQGLLNIYAFNHEEADRSFKEAIRHDPNCAMCHWGVALGLGPNINMPMQQEHNLDALNYSKKALQLSQNSMPHEKALIEALVTRYSADTLINRSSLDSIYSCEMRLVSQRFRNDSDIATLFVESLMNCMPWAYWLPNGQPKDATREVLAVLEYLAEKDPDHPGANHYHIHVVEEFYPELGTQSADRLAALELNAGHLIHMPSHIYIQTGRYNDASISNQKAIKADEYYQSQCVDQNLYHTIYIPHNIHFLSFSASMEGRSELAIKQARSLVEKTPESMLFKYRGIEQYFPMPYLALIRFNKWEEMLKEPKPKRSLLYTNMIWHYARGLAYAHKGELKRAEIERQHIQSIQYNPSFKNLHRPGWPTNDIAEMANVVLTAAIEEQKGNLDNTIKYLRKAVAIQDNSVFVETPHFYYPIRQALGFALLKQNRPDEAQKIFNEDLEKWPNNGWSLFGLYKSYEQQEKADIAKAIKAQFELAWKFADIQL